MKKILCLLTLLSALSSHARAQILPFGEIDTADLKMSSCDFEKDAKAEVLFDYATVKYKDEDIIMERHKRIKIFNDKGKDEANIRIEYYAANRAEMITNLEAETIELDKNIIVHTPIDAKQIYTENTDKTQKAVIFTFPNVKAGSVIEYKYTWTTLYPYNYPDWFFQTDLPSRYSEFDAEFNNEYMFKYFRNVYQPMAKDTIIHVVNTNTSQHTWAMSNIPSYQEEPYMDYPQDYLECVLTKPYNFMQSWDRVGRNMLDDDDFGKQLDKKLTDEKDIVDKANALPTKDEKIAYIFNAVKKTMKWNKSDRWFTIDGTKKAWDKKAGNSTEINLVLYHLLKAAGINTSLAALCTRDNGKLNPQYESEGKFNRTVVYYPVDSLNYYIMDATSPFNTYNNVPYELMGLKSYLIDPENKKWHFFDVKIASARDVVLVIGEIKADGKLVGKSQVSSSAYSRERYLKKYNDLGQKKYTDDFEDGDKKLKILSYEIENMDNDTLPLIQTFDFNYRAADQDGDYLYFNPNVFTNFEKNPFLSDTRVSNIDFGGLYSYSIFGNYKIPDGYAIDALPKSVNMEVPDKGILFRRVLGTEGGVISVRYLVQYKRSLYPRDEYAFVKDFYKKMYEMLNEQIVLKKSK